MTEERLKAKDMFEKLGYKRDKFINAKSDYIDKNFISYGKGKIHIAFSNFSEKPSICKFKDSFFSNKAQDMTLSELQAINQQVKELGWYE